MKVKTTKDVYWALGKIPTGTTLKVQPYNGRYLVIEGPYKELCFSKNVLSEIDDTHTEEEVEAIKQHYIEQLEIEREKNYLLTQAVHNLTDNIEKQNEENARLDTFLLGINRLLLKWSLTNTTKG